MVKIIKKKVFVAGGGSEPANRMYLDIANSIGMFLAKNNYTYGQGGFVGENTLMGETHRGYVMNGGNSVVFIVKEKYKSDIENCNSERVIISDSTNCMVKDISKWADVEIFLPGGNGTLHELVSALESKDLSYSSPKLILLNINSYYDNIIMHYKKMDSEGLLRKDFLKDLIVIVDNLEDLFAILSE